MSSKASSYRKQNSGPNAESGDMKYSDRETMSAMDFLEGEQRANINACKNWNWDYQKRCNEEKCYKSDYHGFEREDFALVLELPHLSMNITCH